MMTNLPTFTGCIVEARPAGAFRMLDTSVNAYWDVRAGRLPKKA